MSDLDLGLLNTPAADIKAPVALPAGLFKFRVTKHEFGITQNENKTPYLRYHCKPVAYGPDIDPQELEGLEWTKRMLRKDFFLTNDALFILTDFLTKVCKINDGGRSTRDLIPEAENCEAWAQVERKQGDDGRIYNNIKRFIQKDD